MSQFIKKTERKLIMIKIIGNVKNIEYKALK